jgi:O-antigen/teichoic acid export membrane protein
LAAESTVEVAPPKAPPSYASGARILSIGIASTGLFTFAYFSVASHVLDDDALGGVNLLWTILFITISVIYRPVEQLLSRSIATRRAQGHEGAHPLRDAARIQAAFAAAFLVVAFALKGTLIDAFDGSSSLFWVLVASALAYAASYFARGYFAGHQWFALYGGLVFFESVARFCFPVAVAVGLASGQTAVALGIAAAPLASLLVIPVAVRRYGAGTADAGDGVPAAPVDRVAGAAREGATFAGAVAVVQLAEQTLLNAGPLFAPKGAMFAVVFNAFLITRSPLQLFQSIQTSLLPHLAGLEATEGSAAFHKAIRTTILAIAAFAGAVALGLLVLGPWAMDLLLPTEGSYGRWGLAVIGVGMGLHLTAGTLNQAALARGQAARAARAWALSAVVFVAWMAAGLIDDALVRAEVGYAGATALLSVALLAIYRAGTPAVAAPPLPDPPPLLD